MGFLVIAPLAILAGWTIFAIHRWLSRSDYRGSWLRAFWILAGVGALIGAGLAFYVQYNVANKRIEGFPIPLRISGGEATSVNTVKYSMPAIIRAAAALTDFLCGMAFCMAPLGAAAFFKENRIQHGTPGGPPP